MIDRFKLFPPGWNNIQIPVHRRAATLAGIATYGPCATKAVWAQRAAWTLVAVGGPRLLPGRSRPWTPPLPGDEWAHLLDELATIVGPFDSHTVYQRRDERAGLLMLLLNEDRSVGFVKARLDDSSALDREQRALTLAEQVGVTPFHTPTVLGAGSFVDWHYLVTSPMPQQMHRMLDEAPAPAILDAIAAVLSGLERPTDLAPHWAPFHGDFTPWNLRSIRGGTPWLFDWEDAGWAPPDADRVFYVASAGAIGHPVSSERLGRSEAVSYWWQEINMRIRQKLAEGTALGPIDYGMLDMLSAGSE